MTNFEWFLLIVVVIGVPLVLAVVITLWTIDQARKRSKQNRPEAQVGVKRKAAVSPEEREARLAAREGRVAAEREDEAMDVSRETSEARTDSGSA